MACGLSSHALAPHHRPACALPPIPRPLPLRHARLRPDGLPQAHRVRRPQRRLQPQRHVRRGPPAPPVRLRGVPARNAGLGRLRVRRHRRLHLRRQPPPGMPSRHGVPQRPDPLLPHGAVRRRPRLPRPHWPPLHLRPVPRRVRRRRPLVLPVPAGGVRPRGVGRSDPPRARDQGIWCAPRARPYGGPLSFSACAVPPPLAFPSRQSRSVFGSSRLAHAFALPLVCVCRVPLPDRRGGHPAVSPRLPLQLRRRPQLPVDGDARGRQRHGPRRARRQGQPGGVAHARPPRWHPPPRHEPPRRPPGVPRCKPRQPPQGLRLRRRLLPRRRVAARRCPRRGKRRRRDPQSRGARLRRRVVRSRPRARRPFVQLGVLGAEPRRVLSLGWPPARLRPELADAADLPSGEPERPPLLRVLLRVQGGPPGRRQRLPRRPVRAAPGRVRRGPRGRCGSEGGPLRPDHPPGIRRLLRPAVPRRALAAGGGPSRGPLLGVRRRHARVGARPGAAAQRPPAPHPLRVQPHCDRRRRRRHRRGARHHLRPAPGRQRRRGGPPGGCRSGHGRQLRHCVRDALRPGSRGLGGRRRRRASPIPVPVPPGRRSPARHPLVVPARGRHHGGPAARAPGGGRGAHAPAPGQEPVWSGFQARACECAGGGAAARHLRRPARVRPRRGRRRAGGAKRLRSVAPFRI